MIEIRNQINLLEENKMMRWNNISYQKIKDAKIIGNSIVVSFEDGDVVKIHKEDLTPTGITSIEWDKLQFSPFEITVPAIPIVLEIPWDKLREITDKDFSEYSVQKAEEQSKLVGKKVKRIREMRGLTQKKLAEYSGITLSTITRIEEGQTDLSFQTLKKILSAMGSSLKDLANQEIEYTALEVEKQFGILIKRLKIAGVSADFFKKKIIPKSFQVILESNKSGLDSLILEEITSYISEIYGWTKKEIWNSPNLIVKPEPAAMAFFKKPTNANENQVRAYSHYAYYLAKVVLKTVLPKSNYFYPENIEEFRSEYFKKYPILNLESLLNYVWDFGISVLPLNDSGVFHGASWNIDGRHIIVLKQSNQSHARWIFDLLHELYHVFVHLDVENTSVIEFEDLNFFTNNEQIEESEANAFANQMIFGSQKRAEELANECVIAANSDIKKLPKAVIQVAEKEKIGVDFLSNYLAFRLSYQDENWWSSANKMQITEPNPFSIASDLLKSKIQMSELSKIGFNLLNEAITN